ncbi:hypothetical protein [Klebsiella pneumoniae]|uniref:hypothetical protein n=1 Tax=Klebsiella pneumoniae TaxID=573 RepID=UPI000AA476E2|nr:hypothetical protein [Klebsiella pneumoniae]MCT4342101.1 hypothetical protein [Klebsiella pneumoniae]CAE5997562.1 hypothetical protein AI2587V1_1405 [Klebsiella pneumoniae]CAE7273946.1 hypothetical protein AI2610V1_1405 [Klebsiella pneumoniae]CAH3268002.1 hypothetical protein AI2587V1_1405 [Klebsiella pneumoniae]CAH3507181.1 hypothetical protein AI2610V1_1405 [Klebsiella pneumoniae]
MTITLQSVDELIASLESAGELSIREQKFLKLAKAFKQLAAENVEAKKIISECREYFIAGVMNRIRPTNEGYLHMICDTFADETPATARIVAGIKADGRAEGINFAASRLAAAFNHGFVEKPMAEVGDVVRMILDAKADLANSPIPPEDGLSGEYAEKALAEWEVELREGADK